MSEEIKSAPTIDPSKPRYIQIKINGKKKEILKGSTVRSYLIQEHINPNIIACEHNGNVIKRKDLDRLTLQEGDSLEIISMIGGG